MIIYQIEMWLDSYKTVPDEIILDIDSTDDPTHGSQQLALFHGYYDQYMYHPIIFGCGGNVIFSYLRPGTRHASRGVIPLMKFLLKHIRKRFPNVKIKLRADSGFAIPRFFENKQRLFHAFIHDVDSWTKSRRVIAKAEVMTQGTNNRFVVTNMDDEPQVIYDDF